MMTISSHDLSNINTNNDDDLIDATVKILKEVEGFEDFIYTDSEGSDNLKYKL